jgi:hypothetical protein
VAVRSLHRRFVPPSHPEARIVAAIKLLQLLPRSYHLLRQVGQRSGVRR